MLRLLSARFISTTCKTTRKPLFSLHSTLKASMSTNPGLLAIHVRGKLVDDKAIDFFQQTIANAKNSVLEKGISRFDVLHSKNDFLLIEVYNSNEGPDEHKKTAHYQQWRDAVAPYMAVPREAKKYRTLFPPQAAWDTPASASHINETTTFLQNNYINNSPNNDDNDNAYHPSMLAVLVDIQVVPGQEEKFIEESIKNCKSSAFEPGVQRFDLIRNTEDPSNFVLVEVYNEINAPAAHKATAHYAEWAEAVKSMMTRPRSATKYRTLFPSSLFWHSNSMHTHLGEGAVGTWGSVGGLGLNALNGGSFSFLCPKITVGRGVAKKEIASSLKSLNIKNPMVITGKGGLSRYSDLFESLGSGSDKVPVYCVKGEPTVEDANDAASIAISSKCDGVLSVGGGSALDLGKVVAALATNLNKPVPSSSSSSSSSTSSSSKSAPLSNVYTYLEVVGEAKSIEFKPLPHIAVPTTSGTGAEATKNAVLKSVQHGRKASIRHDWMLPSVAIIDPSLTLSCPPDVTAHVGLDALCQCIEPFVCNAVNPIVDSVAREGILRSSRSLRNAVAKGKVDLEAREDMSIASLLGGLSLANAKLGAVHGFASVLGGLYETAPHGAICAALLPYVFRKNVQKLEGLLLDSNNDDKDIKAKLERFHEVARIVTGNPKATASQGALWLEALVRDLNVPKLACLLIGNGAESFSDIQIKDIIDGTLVASSTKGNPVVLNREELTDILLRS